jgi:hypothetical protein
VIWTITQDTPPQPSSTTFEYNSAEYDILLTGSPDGILVRSDGSHIIVDYKTAKYTATQDKLFPMYEAQLNAYALIGEQRDLAPVAGLALVYTEPITDEAAANEDTNHRGSGFAMGFAAKVVEVTLDSNLIMSLLERARKIYDLQTVPGGRDGCKDCELLEDLLDVAMV